MSKPERQGDDELELMYKERLRDYEYAYAYEELNVPPRTSTSLVKSDNEVNSFPRSHQPLPDIPLPVAPPTGGDVREEQDESDYI